MLIGCFSKLISSLKGQKEAKLSFFEDNYKGLTKSIFKKFTLPQKTRFKELSKGVYEVYVSSLQLHV